MVANGDDTISQKNDNEEPQTAGWAFRGCFMRCKRAHAISVALFLTWAVTLFSHCDAACDPVDRVMIALDCFLQRDSAFVG
jgi:hypothetical protein